jgi:hypothetical protein
VGDAVDHHASVLVVVDRLAVLLAEAVAVPVGQAVLHGPGVDPLQLRDRGGYVVLVQVPDAVAGVLLDLAGLGLAGHGLGHPALPLAWPFDVHTTRYKPRTR